MDGSIYPVDVGRFSEHFISYPLPVLLWSPARIPLYFSFQRVEALSVIVIPEREKHVSPAASVFRPLV